MRKVMSTPGNKIRTQLLTTASAVALTVSVYAIGDAKAGDADRPQVWVELGAEYQQYSGHGDIFAPPFISDYDWAADRMISPAATQSMHLFSYGGDGSISFQPSNSDWVFSAGIRYGRAHGGAHRHDQHGGPLLHSVYAYYVPGHGFPCCKTRDFAVYATDYADTVASNDESHLIIDFQAGKDVGLGMFGRGSTSTFGAGIRFAQFRSRSHVEAHAREDTQFYNYYSHYPSLAPKYVNASRWHDFSLYGHATRSFKGLGPSVTWNGSVPFIGNKEDGEVTLDWGINAAILFGKQKSVVKHATSGEYFRPKYGHLVVSYPPPATHTRIRNVIVPNAGGFAGLSFRYSDAKVSLGYRGDFFFGAIDGGIDTRRETTRGFYGPFASISIGLGD